MEELLKEQLENLQDIFEYARTQKYEAEKSLQSISTLLKEMVANN